MAARKPRTPKVVEEEVFDEFVEVIEIQEEMERSFLEYSMSVIVSRALPDVRDGLKPVHRRILYSMYDQGLRPDRPHSKCAKVVGEVMGTYHPHGDTAIYDALVRMAQDFSMRHPLIDGHGNFGGTGPDEGAAAMRYTESRLAQLSLSLMAGIDEETVDFIPNYDSTSEEPVVLPARFPNLLVNGSQGIAVGMATNIPPHNLGEVIDATLHLLANPEATSDDLMEFVRGPDFPTGAKILGRQGIQDAYRTGRGSIKMRAVVEIEEIRGGSQIIVTEMPYQVSVESIEEKITSLVKAGELDGITALQNDSAGKKPRLVIRLKRDANPNIILNKLYKQTPLQTSFGFNMLALVDGAPKTLSLSQVLNHYLAHQIEVVTRRTRFRLDKAERREHIVEGLVKAIDVLDKVIATIRKSEDRQAALLALIAKPYAFSEEQAKHILDMTLGRLTKLGRIDLEEELLRLKEEINYFLSILGNKEILHSVISEEMSAIRDDFANERRSAITHDVEDLEVEDLLVDEDIVITTTKAGYIKSVAAGSFKAQSRGGRGVQSTKMKDADLITQVIHSSTLAYLLLFSNVGKVYRLRGHEIPMKERAAKGTAIVNILNLAPGERIEAIVSTKEIPEDESLLFVTKDGLAKKTAFSEYDKSRREGFLAIKLNDSDELVRVVSAKESDECVIVTEKGMAIRFPSNEIREMGRGAAGVRGIKLRAGDHVVSLDVARDEADILIATDTGYAKRTKMERFSAQSRGGMGVRGIKLSAARGSVVAAFMVGLEEEVIFAATDGSVIRMEAREIASQNREAAGVKVMDLEPEQSVAAVARLSD